MTSCDSLTIVFLLCSMTLQATPHAQNPPASTPDPALQAALGELLQMGLVVARVSARLAEIEGRAVEALGENAAEATRNTLAKPASLAAAIETGHQVDASNTVRDAITARIASITDSFDKAARAVRRTAALQARLAEGRPLRAQTPGQERQPNQGDAARHAGNDAERAERMDDPDWDDEIGGRSDEEVVRDICRDLAPATNGETPFSPKLPAAIRAICARAVRPAGEGGWPRAVQFAAEPTHSREAAPEPDT